MYSNCDTFYCNDGDGYMEFGVGEESRSSYTTMRSVFTVYKGSWCRNSPDTNEDANILCQQLGYTSGTVTKHDANSCPEAHWDGSTWTDDGTNSSGYGSDYRCVV